MKELDFYQQELGNESGEAVMRWACHTFSPASIALATSFGAEDQVLTHMAAALKVPIKIFTLDTGRLFQETYDTLAATRQKYGIPIDSYFPDTAAVETMVREKGPNLFYESMENRKLCCGIRKVEPLKRALKGMKAWVVGLRQDQASTRADLKPLEWDGEHSLYKISPLWNWTEAQVWAAVRELKIPTNILQERGFRSLGCAPCTRAIGPQDDIRAGRWWWENPEQRECGLHISKGADGKLAAKRTQ